MENKHTELEKAIWAYAADRVHEKHRERPEVDLAVSQAIAHIDALILWVRERDMAFLERNVYVEVRKLEEAEELDA
jgi:hypothetical protein